MSQCTTEPNRKYRNFGVSVFSVRFVSVRYYPKIPNRNKIAQIALKRCPSMYFSILRPYGCQVGSELSYRAWFSISCNSKNRKNAAAFWFKSPQITQWARNSQKVQKKLNKSLRNSRLCSNHNVIRIKHG